MDLDVAEDIFNAEDKRTSFSAPSSYGQAEEALEATKLSLKVSIIDREIDRRTAEIMRNKSWRYSARVFAFVILAFYEYRVYGSADISSSTSASVLVLVVIIALALYSVNLKYRTLVNAHYKHARFKEMSEMVSSHGEEIEGWEEYIGKERKAWRFDVPANMIEIVLWVAAITFLVVHRVLPSLSA